MQLLLRPLGCGPVRHEPNRKQRGKNSVSEQGMHGRLFEISLLWPSMGVPEVVLSIQAGTVLPSMLLQKLGVYSRHSALYKAFSELGRVERTLFLLEYMSDATLRQQIRAETTKVESYHQFTDWIAFGGPVLRTGDPVEQEKRIKYRDSYEITDSE